MRNKLLTSILAFCALTILAQDAKFDWNTEKPQLLDAAALAKSAAQVSTERFPDADEVQLDIATFVRYEADGTWFQIMDIASKVLTEKGVEDNQVISSWYTATTSRAKISLVQLLKSDGTWVDIDLAQNTSEQIDSSSMRSNIYDPNHKVIKVTVPGLEKGDTLRIVMVDEMLRPRVPNSFSDIYSFEGTSPILHESVFIDAPAELPLKSIVVKDLVGKGPVATQTESNGRISYQWEVADVPQAFTEPDMPQMGQYIQRLLVSTFQNWEEVSRWYWNLCQPRLAVTPAMQEMVTSLVGDATAFEDVVRRIFDFVSSKVRYMGITIEENAPGYEPHDVSRTFEDRAGVCRDKAALLVAMLRAAGLEAYPVLIHVGQPKDEEVPVPFFNHAITAVRDPQTRQFILMDSTAENARDLFPAYLANLNYLVATPEGEPIRLSATPSYTENLLTVQSTGEITEDGTLHLSSNLTFTGYNDNAFRGYFLRLTPDLRRRVIERFLGGLSPSVRLESLLITPEDLQDLSEPLRVRMTISAPNYLIAALNSDGNIAGQPGDLAMLELPQLAPRFGIIYRLFGGATLEKRRFPFMLDFACGADEQISLVLPNHFQPQAIPVYGEVATDTLLWKRELSARPGRLLYSSIFANHKVLFTPEEYQQLKQALKTFEVEDQKCPIYSFAEEAPTKSLTPEGEADEPDAICLEDRIHIEVESPSSWTHRHTMRMKVLTYNGVKSYSDLHWSYNDSTDAPEIIYARVVNPEDGSVHEVPSEMIHRMDASWVASAPRYSPSRTLVVNLPGVAPGSIIEYEILHHITNRNFFSNERSFRDELPAQVRSLEVVVPKELPLQMDYFPQGFLQCGEKDIVKVKFDKDKLPGDRIAYTWEAKDVPMLHLEGMLPPSRVFLPTTILTSGNWKDYANALYATVESLGDGGETIRELVAPFVELPLEQRAIEIRNWIEINIREAGPAFNIVPLAQLTRPETTARDGYGNSADRAILYAAMLKAAGFDRVEFFLAAASPRHPALQNFYQKFPVEFASQWLVRVNGPSGEIWLNDQNRYGQFGTCAYDRGLLFNLQNGKFSTLRLKDELRNLDRSQMRIDIAADGTAQITYREIVRGTEFGVNRRFYAQLPPEERRRHYQSIISNLSQNARPITPDLETDFQQYPGEISYTAKVANFATFDGDYCYFTLPISLGAPLEIAKTTHRFNVIHWEMYNQVEEIIVTLPPNYPVAVLMPSDYVWKAPADGGFISWTCRPVSSASGQVTELHFTYQVDTQPAFLMPRHFPQLQEGLRHLQHPSATTILLSK